MAGIGPSEKKEEGVTYLKIVFVYSKKSLERDEKPEMTNQMVEQREDLGLPVCDPLCSERKDSFGLNVLSSLPYGREQMCAE